MTYRCVASMNIRPYYTHGHTHGHGHGHFHDDFTLKTWRDNFHISHMYQFNADATYYADDFILTNVSY
jgi:hypothetical protein